MNHPPQTTPLTHPCHHASHFPRHTSLSARLSSSAAVLPPIPETNFSPSPQLLFHQNLSTSHPSHFQRTRPRTDRRTRPPPPSLIPPPPLLTFPSHPCSIRVPSVAPPPPPRFPKRTEPSRRNCFPYNTKPPPLLAAQQRTQRRTDPRTSLRTTSDQPLPARSLLPIRPLPGSALHFRCPNRSGTL